MKRRIVHILQKYLFNPPVKFMFAIGLAMPGRALLETIGRKSGKPRRVPVGIGLVGRQFWIVAEHGQKAAYVRNIVENPRVRLKLRDGMRSRWHKGTAYLLPDDDPASANVGSRRSFPAAPAMPPPSAFSVPNYSRFELIWMSDARREEIDHGFEILASRQTPSLDFFLKKIDRIECAAKGVSWTRRCCPPSFIGDVLAQLEQPILQHT